LFVHALVAAAGYVQIEWEWRSARETPR